MKNVINILKFDLRQQAAVLGAFMLAMLVFPLLLKASTRDDDLGIYFKVALGAVALTGFIFLIVAVTTTGNSTSPREHRNWMLLLPVDPWRLALGKLAYSVCVFMLIPGLLLCLGYLCSELIPGTSINTPVFSFNSGAFLLNTAFLFWLLLGSALLHERLAVLGIPVFFLSELFSHRLLTLLGFSKKPLPDLTPNWLHNLLLLVLVLALGALFVHYHQKRQRTLAIVGMLVALLGITALRASLGSLFF